MDRNGRPLLRLCLAAALIGLAIGIVGTAFRSTLAAAEGLRAVVLADLHRYAGLFGLFVTIGLVAVAAGVARWLVVRFAPMASGSGVQHVEAVMRGEVASSPLAVIPVKFCGGVLAMGSGLALGREGPTVQMGAAFGAGVGRWLLPGSTDRTICDAAGAGAGLAVAFNAPLGGAILVFEELTRRFTPRLVVATVIAVAVAITVFRLVAGDQPDFAAGTPEPQTWAHLPLFLGLGLALGGIGAASNRLTLVLLEWSDRRRSLPSPLRAALIGAAIGGFAWFAPTMVGGGDPLVASILAGPMPVGLLMVVFGVRFVLGPVSYSAGTPGGLFAPLLVVGAAFGALYAGLVAIAAPATGLSPVGCAVVGMSALFTAMIRAPLTGIAVVIEMTGRADLALAMLVASTGTLIVTGLLGSEPIYDSLRRRMLAGPLPGARPPAAAIDSTAGPGL